MRICETCKKEFKPHRMSKGRFCKISCYWKGKLGQSPWNKGKKTGLVPRSAFKKGQLPWNTGHKSGITQAEYRRSHYLRNKARYIFQATWRKQRIKKENLDPTADTKKINAFYLLAEKLTEERGIKYCVDHILPLSRGGKHHQDNLQVITITDNSRKGTKYPFEVKEKHFPGQFRYGGIN